MNNTFHTFETPNAAVSIAEQAIAWHMRIEETGLSQDEQAQFETWLQHAEHAQAYARVQGLWNKFDDVAPEVMHPILGNPDEFFATKKPRKKNLKNAAITLSIFFIGFAVYQQQNPEHLWVANYQTNIGEQRTVQLPDSSTLILNTQTVVKLDFTNQQRNILLEQGELFINVAKDKNRPLIVTTQNATARALGTQFTVQFPFNQTKNNDKNQLDIKAETQTKVAVLESKVETCTSRAWYQFKPSNCVILSTEEVATIEQQTITPIKKADVAQMTGWVTGKLAFDNQALSVVLAELQRYSTFELKLAKNNAEKGLSLKDLRVSGVFPAQNTGRSLELLASRLPIKIKQVDQTIIISAR